MVLVWIDKCGGNQLTHGFGLELFEVCCTKILIFCIVEYTQQQKDKQLCLQ